MTLSRQGQQCHRDDGKVRPIVEIVVVIVVARHAVAIIVDIGKMPAHWYWLTQLPLVQR
jgi:hypothetical protein